MKSKSYKRTIDDGVNVNINTVTVEQKTIGRGHKYIVTGTGSDIDGLQLPSVTTITGATDGSSTNPISRWSVKNALEYIKQNTYPVAEDDFPIDMEEIIDRAKKEPDRILKQSGDRGTRIHNAVEAYLDSQDNWRAYLGQADNKEKLKTCFEKIESWISEIGFEVKALEIPVFHDALCYGGSIDMVISDNNRRIYVCDFKTGSNIYFKDGLQISAYIGCLASMISNNIDIWNGYGSDMSYRKEDLQLGGAVIHIKEESESVTINHLPDALIGGTSFMYARGLYDNQREHKFNSHTL